MQRPRDPVQPERGGRGRGRCRLVLTALPVNSAGSRGWGSGGPRAGRPWCLFREVTQSPPARPPSSEFVQSPRASWRSRELCCGQGSGRRCAGPRWARGGGRDEPRRVSDAGRRAGIHLPVFQERRCAGPMCAVTPFLKGRVKARGHPQVAALRRGFHSAVHQRPLCGGLVTLSGPFTGRALRQRRLHG